MITESQFRGSDDWRAELAACLNHPTFQRALSIVTTVRSQRQEALERGALAGPEVISVRLSAMNAGASELISDLYKLTTPEPVKAPEEQSTFGHDEERQKLDKLGYKY